MVVQTTDNTSLSGLVRLNSKRYPFLLQSSTSSDKNDNNIYDILFAFPKSTLIKDCFNTPFLNNITDLAYKENPYNLPFIGGYFVYLSYEVLDEIEYIANLPQDSTLPIAYLVEINNAIIYNHNTQTTTIVANSKDEFNTILTDISHLHIQSTSTTIHPIITSIKEDDAYTFLQQVKKCREYIISGDIFQANLSREWNLTLNKNIEAIDIFNSLMQYNPAPFSAYANFAGFQILSSSPERLFNVHDNIIQTRPIAGTRPRDDTLIDTQMKTKLRENLKEQAEHIMLLDLERNDLGRISKYGTVEVNEIMAIESHKYVHHIVSNIKGELKKGITFKDIIKALFPGGTITGCPKVRSMEIISELENKPRGAYTGSLGYISKCGNMDFNILIRTIVKHNLNLTIKAGAGIVYDSIPEKELEETRHKAKGMLKVFNIDA